MVKKLLSLFVLPGSSECDEVLSMLPEDVAVFDITTVEGMQNAMRLGVPLTVFPALVFEEDGRESICQGYNSVREML